MGPKKRPQAGERKQNPNQAATAKKRTASNATPVPGQQTTTTTTTTTTNSEVTTSLPAITKTGSSKKVNQTQKTKKTQSMQRERGNAKGERNTKEEVDKKVKRSAGIQQPDSAKKTGESNKSTTVCGKSTSNKIDKLENQSIESSTSDVYPVTALESKHDNAEKKDDKTKALNKMLKNLDIQISGFDNILPTDQHISSISENVKTKSRAAAVRVAACLSSAKPATTLKRVRTDTDKSQQLTTSPKDESKVNSDGINKKESQASVESKDLTLESHSPPEEKEVCVVETKKKMAAKKYKLELNNQKIKKATQNKTINEQIEQPASENNAEMKNAETEDTNILKKKQTKAKVVGKKCDDSGKMTDNTEDGEKILENSDAVLTKAENIEISCSAEQKSADTEIKSDPVVKSPKKSLSPKNVKSSPKTEQGIRIDAIVTKVEETEETLKIVLDANTEVVQMDIEEMPSRSTKIDAPPSNIVEECSEQVTSETSNNAESKPENMQQESLQSKDLQKSTTPNAVNKQKITNKFASLQGKSSKVTKITNSNKNPLEVSASEKSLAEIKAEGNKKDIYDFKSGSEEEENIKMELPVLKDLRELEAERDHPVDKSEDNKKDVEKIDETAEKAADATEEAGTSTVKSANNRKIKTAILKKPVLVKVVGKCYKKKTIVIKKAYNAAKAKTVIKSKKHKKVVAKVSEDEDEEEESDSEDEKKLVIYEQKRYRMASLNALAKVQCLYENESRTAYELGLSKATQLPPKMRNVDVSEDEKEKEKDNDANKTRDNDKTKEKKKDEVEEVEVNEQETEIEADIDGKKDVIENDKIKESQKTAELEIDKTKDVEEKVTNEDNDNSNLNSKVKEASDDESKVDTKRKFRNIPGGRGVGKHWEMDSDSENDDFERVKMKKKKWQKKIILKKEKVLAKDKKDASNEKNQKSDENDKLKDDAANPVRVKRKYTKRKNIVKPVEKLDEQFAEEGDDKNEENNTKDAEQQEDNDNTKKDKLEGKKPPKKRLKRILKEELIGDYKGILARKRMASLNASAIVAATYEVERHLDKNLEAAYSSYESSDDNDKSLKKFKDMIAASKAASKHDSKMEKGEAKSTSTAEQTTAATKDVNPGVVTNIRDGKSTGYFNEESNDSKYSKETKETGTDTTTSAGLRDTASVKDTASKEPSRPTSTSVVIVQDTDVTITGVYVNSTTGSSQEAYCKMQYRVQSSVTAEERVLRPSSVEPPKSYTPLSALSSMLPPSSSSALADGKILKKNLFLSTNSDCHNLN